MLGFTAKDAGADRMEGAQHHAALLAAQQVIYPAFHFPGSLVGEGDRQNVERTDSLSTDKIGYAVG